jgi:integrase
MGEALPDAAGRRRSPATLPGFHAGRPPRNRGRRYPADPPTVEEIVAVMRAARDRRHGRRLRGLIVVLWRAGLRIHEALALNESDLDHRRGALLVRGGKGGRPREVGVDEWAWEHLQPWIDRRLELPVGPCSASSTAPHADDPGHPQPPAPSSAAQPQPQAFAGASRRISSATPTPSRWRTRASRSSSSSASWATATLASPRSTSRASTTPRIAIARERALMVAHHAGAIRRLRLGPRPRQCLVVAISRAGRCHSGYCGGSASSRA